MDTNPENSEGSLRVRDLGARREHGMEMAILACDECGKPAKETVTIKTERGNVQKDLCADHLAQLLHNARQPRVGRRAKTAPLGEALAAGLVSEQPRRRGRPKGSKNRPKTTAASERGPGRPKGSRNKKSTAKKTAAKKRTVTRRPRKRTSEEPVQAASAPEAAPEQVEASA